MNKELFNCYADPADDFFDFISLVRKPTSVKGLTDDELQFVINRKSSILAV